MSNGESKSPSDIFEEVENISQRQSGYLKLKDGEVRTLQFNPSKIELVDNEFNGKVTKRVEYKVLDSKANDGEKTLSMAIRNARQINRLIQRGRTKLEIERIGSDLNTVYNISTA